jgi:ketosteroid isomerase-like protein
MNSPEAAAVVRAYYDAWSSKNFTGAAALLDDALRVEGPINEYSTARSFVPALTDFVSAVSAVKVVAAMSDRDEAMMLYDLDVERLGPLRVVEHYTVAEGKITRICQILDTAAVRAAGMAHPGQDTA